VAADLPNFARTDFGRLKKIRRYAMGLLMKIPDRPYEIQPLADLTARARDMARILIVCEADSDTDLLQTL
jgi:hypothetical protein